MRDNEQHSAELRTFIQQEEQAQWAFLYTHVHESAVAAVVVEHLLDHESVSGHRGLFLRVMVTIEKDRRRAVRVASLRSAVRAAVRAAFDVLRGRGWRTSGQARLQELLRDPALTMELAQALQASDVAQRRTAEPGLGQSSKAA